MVLSQSQAGEQEGAGPPVKVERQVGGGACDQRGGRITMGCPRDAEADCADGSPRRRGLYRPLSDLSLGVEAGGFRSFRVLPGVRLPVAAGPLVLQSPPP